MPVIDCGKSITLKSSKTDTGYAIRRNGACSKAQANAQRAVNTDLNAQQQQYTCKQPCDNLVPVPKLKITTHPCANCGRVWWTLFILVRCDASADGEMVLTC